MAYLKYDTELMAETKTAYLNAVDEMEQMREAMQKMVDSIEDAWKSEAGDAFFDKYNNEWLQGFTRYKEVLLHMAGNLGTAADGYTEITGYAESLDIDASFIFSGSIVRAF